jgi:hypothetical protein
LGVRDGCLVPDARGTYLTDGTASGHGRGGRAMCYTRRDQGFEERARRLRAEDERRRKAEAKTPETRQTKPLTEKVKEMVGAR